MTEEAADMETVPDEALVNFVGEGRANVVFELTGVDDHTNLRGMPLTPHRPAGMSEEQTG